MVPKLSLFGAMLISAATPALAQDFAGSIDINHTNITEDDADIASTQFAVSGAIAISPQFAFGANVASYDVETVDDAATNITLHGMYRVSPTATIGLFASQDTQGDFDNTAWGIETGVATRGAKFEAYYGWVDGLDGTAVGFDDFSIWGGSVAFRVAQGFSLTAAIDAFSGSDDDYTETFSTATIGGLYDFGNGAAIYADLGSIGINGRDDEYLYDFGDASYVGIGARFAFGADRGTVLGPRGVDQSFFPSSPARDPLSF